MNEVKFDFPIKIVKNYITKEADGENWYIEGYATTSDYDLHGDIISDEAIKASENDLIENSTVLYNHRDDQPIGRVVATKFTKQGLWIKVLISKTEPNIWKKITEGVLNKFSIGARVLEATKDFVEDIGKVATIIRKMLLVEVSLVAVPANPKARALDFYIGKALREFEEKGGEIPMGIQPPMQGHASEDAFAGDATPRGEDIVTDEKGAFENGGSAPETSAPVDGRDATGDLKEALQSEQEEEVEEEIIEEEPVEEAEEEIIEEVEDETVEEEVEEIVEEPVEEEPKVVEKRKLVIVKAKSPEGLLLQAMKEPNLDDVKALISQAMEMLREGSAKPEEKKPEPKKKPTKTKKIVKKVRKNTIEVTKDELNAMVEREVEKAIAENTYSRKGFVGGGTKTKTQTAVEAANRLENPEEKLKALLTIQHNS